MNSEFFEALSMLEKERGIPAEYMLEKIKGAIIIAAQRDYNAGDNVFVDIDPDKHDISVLIRRDVVEEIEDPKTQISENEAQRYKEGARIGDIIEIPVETKDFGRIAAQTAKHVIRQNIREAERNRIYDDLQGRQGEIVNAVVLRIDQRKGSAVFEIGKTEAMLPKQEMLPGEELHEGDHVALYISDITVSDKGPRVMISRTNAGLVRRLFETEVPEIFDGTVEVKGVSREAGMRTKLAVTSKDPNVDARGACIGPKGTRVAKIVDELGGEKIDVILWNEDPVKFIAEALSPAKVLSVEIPEEGVKACRVTVPDDQLSLAIGNKGQNARLAARLTGYKIDIRPESGYYGEED